ncbi:KamA family radical SAM protein [Pseudoalteromonas rhizosphaerae]|uniref:KamA family radical SAM protein n=1 Tax=Pseudoalteromonas rhizosphaerae TaxID=2518973 RepID=UPI0038504E4F
MENIAIKLVADSSYKKTKFISYQRASIDRIPQLKSVSSDLVDNLKLISMVLPFRVNNYVLDNLIDWNKVPNDPVFKLVFPQPSMLKSSDIERLRQLVKTNANKGKVNKVLTEIQEGLNPHPSGQIEFNIPEGKERSYVGLQHKYDETVLFFPSQGQYCHSYCSFCFRWAQFVSKSTRMNSRDKDMLHSYLATHTKVTDLLITGGDPMVMKSWKLGEYLLPLLEPKYDHITNIRLGSKALTFWPNRFIHDQDADNLLRLIEQLSEAGKHISFMAHLNHPQEMRTTAFETAVSRLQNAGAIIRTQSPLLKNVNNDATVWKEMWEKQINLNMIPYYMFVERDTGSKRYFELPLAEAWAIYRDAYAGVSGLARTARGPSMSAAPGKVEIMGVDDILGEKVFVLRFIQGRNSDWVNKPFFAKFDPKATWLDHLKPAFGEKKFFFEE